MFFFQPITLQKISPAITKKLIHINVDETLFTDVKSFDDEEYICKTCHFKVLKGKIPCQAVYNNIYVDKIPSEFPSLEKLEQILVSQRIVFEKIIIMPKGQHRKVNDTCKVLPRPPE